MMDTENTHMTYYTCIEPNLKANAGLYITFFRMVHLNLTPNEAFKPLQKIASQFRPFRDASTLPSTSSRLSDFM